MILLLLLTPLLSELLEFCQFPPLKKRKIMAKEAKREAYQLGFSFVRAAACSHARSNG